MSGAPQPEDAPSDSPVLTAGTSQATEAPVSDGPIPLDASRRRAEELTTAREALRYADPVMAALVDALPDVDPYAFRDALPIRGLFEALLYQVVGQQISVRALDAIFARLRAVFPGGVFDPAVLAATDVETLRGIGLSGQKARYVIGIAAHAVAGGLDGLGGMPHEEARELLVELKGVGPWTVDGALLLAFGGGDVLLCGDLVIRKAVQRAYGLPALPSVEEVEALGERWRPHRSLAAAYLWRSLD